MICLKKFGAGVDEKAGGLGRQPWGVERSDFSPRVKAEVKRAKTLQIAYGKSLMISPGIGSVDGPAGVRLGFGGGFGLFMSRSEKVSSAVR